MWSVFNEMAEVEVRLEKSKSRRGKHAVRDLALIVYEDCRIVEPKIKHRIKVKPIYARGEAWLVKVHIPEGAYLVHMHFIRNLRGHVKGVIRVMNSEGVEVLKVVYRKLKIRKSSGDSSYAWVVEKVVNHLKLPVKRFNV